MKCDVYKDLNKNNYLLVPTGKDISNFIEDLKITTFQFFKQIDLLPEYPLIIANSKDALQSLKTKGYFYIQDVNKEKTEGMSEIGAAIGGGILIASFGINFTFSAIGALAIYLLFNNIRKKQNAY